MGLFSNHEAATLDSARKIMKEVHSAADYEALSEEDRELVRGAIPKLIGQLSADKRAELVKVEAASDVIEQAIKDMLTFVARDETTAEDCTRHLIDIVGNTTVAVHKIFRR